LAGFLVVEADDERALEDRAFGEVWPGAEAADSFPYHVFTPPCEEHAPCSDFAWL